MKSRGVEILAAAVVLFVSASPVMAALVEFNDGGVHNIDYEINDHVWVDYQSPGMGTTLNILDGADIPFDYHVEGFENSIINMSGGSIDGDLAARGSSQVDISGGSIASSLYAWGSSQVTLSGGSIDGWLWARVKSQVTFSGGSIGGLFAFGRSQVNISGGSIGGELITEDSGILTINGSDFAVDGMPFGYGELTSIFGGPHYDEPYRHLTGILASGDLLDNQFRIGNNAKIALVPEPATLLLLGLGGLALLRKRN